jgi:hypothetical protein
VTPPPAIEIQWEAPAACPDAARVRALTERLLGKSLSVSVPSGVRASGKVTQNDAGKWQLRTQLVVGERVEEETLVANKCSALAEAMALKLALALDPLAVVEAVQPEPPPPAAEPQPPPPTTTPASHAERRHRFGVRLVGSVALGPLPRTTPGVGTFMSLQWRRFRLELGGEAFWAGVARYESPPGVGADLQLFAGTVRGCVTPGAGRWWFPICWGSELGVMRGRGFGVPESAVTTGVWGGLALGPALQWRMTRRFSLWLEADAVLTLLRPEFHMRNLPTLYQPPALSGRALAGFEADF